MRDKLRRVRKPDDEFVIICDAQYYPIIVYARTDEEAQLARDELNRSHGAHYDAPATICIARIQVASDCAVPGCTGKPEISLKTLRRTPL